MAILQLSPRDYRNLKWDLTPSNIIDTVSGNVMSNKIENDYEPAGPWERTSGALVPYATSVSLPIALKTDGSSYVNYNHIIGWKRYTGPNAYAYSAFLGRHLYGYGRREITSIQGSFTFSVPGAVDEMPLIEFTFTGQTREKVSNFTLDEFPSKASGGSGNEFAQLHSDYYSFNSWDKHFKNIQGIQASDLNTSEGRIGSSEAVISTLVPKVTGNIKTCNFYNYGIQERKAKNSLGYEISTLTRYANATSLGAGEYRVDWFIPVRDMVMVNIRNRGAGQYQYQPAELNGAAIYLDMISSITFTAKFKRYSTAKIQFTYSLDGNNLTESQIKNQYPIKLTDNEIITRNSTMAGQPWKEKISSLLLNKYKKGKHIAIVDVNGVWAIQNSLTINSEIQIINIQGNKISRKGVPCTFQVKGIEKVFQQETFIYRLILLEV